MSATEYDPHNDRFVHDASCPYPDCDEPLIGEPATDKELFYCGACQRPVEVVRLRMAEGSGGASPYVARRARLAYCPHSGREIREQSILDFAGAGGGAGHSSSMPDSYGRVFGAPSRDREWHSEEIWHREAWGHEDRARPDEQVTSLHIHRGVVVAVSAAGRIGLFDAEGGAPLLKRPLESPNAAIDESDPAKAIRLPAAMRAGHLVMTTDQRAIFRDISGAIFQNATARALTTQAARPGAQFIGAPCIAGGEPEVFLLEGDARGATLPAEAVRARAFSLAGEALYDIDIGTAVRPLAYCARLDRMITVNELGHIITFAPRADAKAKPHLPSEMFALATTERAHLVIVDSAAGEDELWLVDDLAGRVRVWRTELAAVLAGKTWNWQCLYDDATLGQVRGFAVGHGSTVPANVQSQYFVISSERATAAYSRALKSPSSDTVLPGTSAAPPVMNALGYLIQDQSGLVLRGFPAWNFKDDNPVRRMQPIHPEVKPPFYDRTIALFGRNAYYATGGLISAVRFVEQGKL